jgi:hypothetical protein
MLNSYHFEQAKIGLTAQFFCRDCPVNPAFNFSDAITSLITRNNS